MKRFILVLSFMVVTSAYALDVREYAELYFKYTNYVTFSWNVEDTRVEGTEFRIFNLESGRYYLVRDMKGDRSRTVKLPRTGHFVLEVRSYFTVTDEAGLPKKVFSAWVRSVELASSPIVGSEVKPWVLYGYAS